LWCSQSTWVSRIVRVICWLSPTELGELQRWHRSVLRTF
jgi:hypothetical protein